MFSDLLSQRIRDQFHHVDTCPYQGPRILFENAGGSLTLKSVVRVNAEQLQLSLNSIRVNQRFPGLFATIDAPAPVPFA